MFLKILQNLQKKKNPMSESLCNKVSDCACNFIKKQILAHIFACDFLTTPQLQISQESLFVRNSLFESLECFVLEHV